MLGFISRKPGNLISFQIVDMYVYLHIWETNILYSGLLC